MSQEKTAELEAPITAKENSKKKSEAAKSYPKKLAKKAKSDENEFDFVGRVESINVKGAGVDSYQFLFSLIDKKGAHKSYLLDPSEPLRFSAMAGLLNAASASGAKVKIRSTLNPGGLNFAGELEIRTKV
jgi:hypothetical protein